MDQYRGKYDLLTAWANGGRGMGFSENGDPETADLRAQVLAQMQLADPNTKSIETFDASKLPQFGSGSPMTGGVFSSLASLSENGAGDRMRDPTKMFNDPNYGSWTSRANLNQAANDGPSAGIMGQLERYMPSVISAVMSMATGVPVASLVQGVAAADSGDWKGMSMQNLLASIAGMIANQYVPGASTAINLVNGQVRKGP